MINNPLIERENERTPPVAQAAYAGAAIVQANPMKTAFTATRLAISAFIVPYVFALIQ